MTWRTFLDNFPISICKFAIYFGLKLTTWLSGLRGFRAWPVEFGPWRPGRFRPFVLRWVSILKTEKVLTYEDVVGTRQKRDMKDAVIREQLIFKRSRTTLSKVIVKRDRSHEREVAMVEIRASSMEECYSVLNFGNSRLDQNQ